MSRTPEHRNHIQSALYHEGVKRIGPDSANISPDHEVRMQGVLNLGKKALKVTAVAGGITGAALLAGHAFDNSPTQRHFVEMKEEQERERQEAENSITIPVEQVPCQDEVTVYIDDVPAEREP